MHLLRPREEAVWVAVYVIRLIALLSAVLLIRPLSVLDGIAAGVIVCTCLVVLRLVGSAQRPPDWLLALLVADAAAGLVLAPSGRLGVVYACLIQVGIVAAPTRRWVAVAIAFANAIAATWAGWVHSASAADTGVYALTAIFIAVAATYLSFALRRANEAVEAERLRMSLELHDDVGKSCSAVALMAATLPELVRRDPIAGAELATRLAAHARNAEQNAKLVAARLRRDSGAEGLGERLRWMCEDWSADHNVRCTINLPENLKASGSLTECFASVADEALLNVARHANATEAVVTAGVNGGLLSLEISDDGIGCADVVAGLGLDGMSRRVGAINGTVVAASLGRRGFSVLACAPVRLDSAGVVRPAERPTIDLRNPGPVGPSSERQSP